MSNRLKQSLSIMDEKCEKKTEFLSHSPTFLIAHPKINNLTKRVKRKPCGIVLFVFDLSKQIILPVHYGFGEIGVTGDQNNIVSFHLLRMLTLQQEFLNDFS